MEIKDHNYFRCSPTRTYQNSYRWLPTLKPRTSFENVDTGFSRLHRHVGCIAAEPLVVPTRTVAYIEERIAPPTKAVF